MAGRDWTDGEPWGEESYEEVCGKCGTTNKITVKLGPPGGDESYKINCDKCGDAMDPVKAFGLVSVKKEQKKRG